MERPTHNTHFVKRVDTSLLDADVKKHFQQAGSHYTGVDYPVSWPLKECRSTWLCNAESNFRKDFSDTENAIRVFTRHAVKIGRAYYCTIDSGKKIYPHVDADDYFDEVERFQVYLDIPEGCEIVQDRSEIAPHSLVRFNHSVPHSYINNNQNGVSWTFIVFDVYKKEYDLLMQERTDHVEQRRQQELLERSKQEILEENISKNVEPIE